MPLIIKSKFDKEIKEQNKKIKELISKSNTHNLINKIIANALINKIITNALINIFKEKNNNE